MKKKNMICALLSNIAIIILISVLFFVCMPVPTAVATSSPIYNGDREGACVALMFNVYEGTDNVEKILKILSINKVTATFFVGGVWVEKNADLLKTMAQQCEIGNHGYLHLDHKTLSERRNTEEIMLCHNLVKQLSGIEMDLFAPPSGSYGNECINVCKDNGYRVIMWSKDTIDWRDKDSELIIKRATSDIQSGDLILMHPTDQTVIALPNIISKIKEKKLSLCTVSETLDGTTLTSKPGGIIRRLFV